MTAPQTNTYEQFADCYAQSIRQAQTTPFSFYHDLVVPYLLKVLGDVVGCTVLEAGCGEGSLARVLASQGATVTAIDIAPRLVALAKTQVSPTEIEYLVHDLSKPLPQFEGVFDVVVSNLVLNDVYDYSGYIRTLAAVMKPGGRLVLSLNNPYSAVIREKVTNYFDSGTAVLYSGMTEAGIKVYYFHRTLEEYMSAFQAAGLGLTQLSDAQVTEEMLQRGAPAKYYQFPYFMILKLVKAELPTTKD